MQKHAILKAGLIFILLLAAAGQAAAQTNVAKWLRFDVNINIQQNSGIIVEEIHEVSLVSGATTFSRVIPTGTVENISNITVSEISPGGGQRSYQAADTGAEFTFQTQLEEDKLTVQLHFPPNNVSSTRFVLKYFLTGAMRFYDEGDRFEWRPFGNRTVAPIDSSMTVIRFPAEFAEADVTRTSSGLDNVNHFFSNGNTVTFNSANIPPGRQLEVSTKFPHGVVEGSPPPWQQTFDTTQRWRPILQGASVILGLLFLLLGLGGVFGWWYLRVRLSPDKVGKVPKYLKSPPGDLTPALAGALLEGKATARHMFATLVSLAQRGALNIEPSQKDPDSLLPDDQIERTFDLYAVDQEKAASPYELTLYTKIFGHLGGKTRQLSEVRQTVFMAVPELKSQIDLEIAKAGYFSEEIGVARRQYAAFGGAGVLMSLVLVLLMAILLGGRFTYLVVCPFLATAVAASGLIAVGFALPKRTEAGQAETVRWEAFRRYLNDMGVKEAAKARARFARLLPYAVAFGLEKDFVKKFGRAKAPIPGWWGKPEEKLPDTSHNQSHEWVSAGLMDSAASRQQPQKTRTKSGLRRLGKPAAQEQGGALLKHIQGAFLDFLEAGYELFAKAPPLDEEEEFDFEALEQQR